ncbi:probable serine/threonine-protein kinase PBL19 isoform X2 [Momordica charantia]|uniref:non-specific serine/threonine protein kinase n=1 Tax=Momordica charantia TaxID=3673 RepID=A0A6J1D4Z6_MOMCH|nr:probable serine/threonine-protein kinase PBL19 isoform X2 [Momordica charantia]
MLTNTSSLILLSIDLIVFVFLLSRAPFFLFRHSGLDFRLGSEAMKCFHFTNGERRDDEDGVVSRASKVSWARSLSMASSTFDTRRSEFDSDYSRDVSDSIGFYEFLTQRRANDLRVFSFSELRSATRGFSRALLIGEGGFGCVFKGLVRASGDDENGGSVSDLKMEVAIKQLNRNGFQGHKEWINEVNFLGVVKHPNLVKLVGYCAEDDERGMQRLLVYELMRNRSLEDHLVRVSSPLSWLARLKIAQDAARGLAYLHEEMDFQLIFRDLKASNILIDEEFNAKLSDFGLARQGPPEGISHVSTSVVGTIGYAAPEYVQTGRLTAKSDVWSFGVVLYELITGRRAVERNLPRNEQKLLEWVKPYVSGPKKFHLIIDPRLEGECDIKSAQKLASLANRCLMRQPKNRPKMSEVVEILGNIITESCQDETIPQPIGETDETKEETLEDTDVETTTRHRNSHLKKVFDFRDIVNLRNKSFGKLDWRNWTPGLVRTW